jgi:hypothetical protein
VVDVGLKPLLDLAQHGSSADAGDQQAAGGPASNADRGTGADPVFWVTINHDDLVVRDLDAKLMTRLASLQPEAMRI